MTTDEGLRMDMTMREPLLTTKQAADRIGLTESFLEARRVRGDGPLYVRISQRCVRYAPGDLAAWVDERRTNSTSDSG